MQIVKYTTQINIKFKRPLFH